MARGCGGCRGSCAYAVQKSVKLLKDTRDVIASESRILKIHHLVDGDFDLPRGTLFFGSAHGRLSASASILRAAASFLDLISASGVICFLSKSSACSYVSPKE